MKKTTIRMKRSVSIIMLVLLLTSMLTMFAVPSFAATSGKVNSSTYCTVQISDKLLSKPGLQYAKVKINITDMLGWWGNSAKIRVTLRDQWGGYITSWVTKGGTTIKLGDDHRIYRIYIEVYNEPIKDNMWSRVVTAGDNFLNTGSAVNWKITNAKNCSIR